MIRMNVRGNAFTSTKSALLLATLCHFVACDSSSTSGSGNACQDGDLRCACYPNDTCKGSLSCASGICVKLAPDNAGGSNGVASSTNLGGQSSMGGSAAQQDVLGGNAAVDATGGASPTIAAGGVSPTTTTGGAAVAATSGGGPVSTGSGGVSISITTGGTTGGPTTGGSPTVPSGGGVTSPIATGGTTTYAATGGVPVAIATGGAPVSVATGGAPAINNSPVIDAFASCDDKIENNSGRTGKWYAFADADFNATHAYGDPGTQWADHGCAAWIILGCTGTACTYGGIGLQLSDGNPYDLSSFSGVSVAFEGKDNVYFVVKTSDGGYFGSWLMGTTGNQTRNVDFASLAAMANSAATSLNLRLVTELQFTLGKSLELSSGFGFAIHSVSLR